MALVKNKGISLATLTILLPILVGFFTTLPQEIYRRRAHDRYHFCKVMGLGVSTFRIFGGEQAFWLE
jgi:hypothetical protein